MTGLDCGYALAWVDRIKPEQLVVFGLAQCTKVCFIPFTAIAFQRDIAGLAKINQHRTVFLEAEIELAAVALDCAEWAGLIHKAYDIIAKKLTTTAKSNLNISTRRKLSAFSMFDTIFLIIGN